MRFLPIYDAIKQKNKRIAQNEGIIKDPAQSVDEVNINIFDSEGINGIGIAVSIDNTVIKGQKRITTKVTRQFETYFPEDVETDEQRKQYLHKFEQYPRCDAKNVDNDLMIITCDQESEQINQEDQIEPLINHEIDVLYEKVQKNVSKIEDAIKKEHL